jgi:hypothetical protein
MSRPGLAQRPAKALGAALAVVLVLTAAGMALSSVIAGAASFEFAMASQVAQRQRAFEAAEAGLATALRAREWSAAAPWTAAGTLREGGEWQVAVRLAAARLDPGGAPVEWHFEIDSQGRDGAARVALVQGFRVMGALPGEPQPSWWRQAEPPP